MSRQARRVVCVLVVLLPLSLPVAAQADREPLQVAQGVLAALWNALTAPFSALWTQGAESVPDANRIDTPILREPTPGSPSDGRSTLDPLG
jgi:hypothetical protein